MSGRTPSNPAMCTSMMLLTYHDAAANGCHLHALVTNSTVKLNASAAEIKTVLKLTQDDTDMLATAVMSIGMSDLGEFRVKRVSDSSAG